MDSWVRGFALSAVAGLGTALVTAPRPGRETRASIQAQVDGIRAGMEKFTPSGMRRQAGGWLGDAVDLAEARRPELVDALVGLASVMAQTQSTEGRAPTMEQRDEMRQQISQVLDQVLAISRSWAEQLKEGESTWIEPSSS